MSEDFDITVLVDGSGSVLPDDYANSINFIQDLLSLFNISEYGTRVTLAQFSTDLRTYAQCFRVIIEIEKRKNSDIPIR